MSDRQRFGRGAPRIALPIALLIALPVWALSTARDVSAATLYDFSWSDGGTRSATGALILGASVGVDDPFGIGDVISFELELFVGAASLGTGTFPPFDSAFQALEGTRSAASLAIVDLYVAVPFGIRLGCEFEDCVSGEVLFVGDTVDFGSMAAARASFVFTEVPEPRAGAATLAAVLAIAGLRARRGAAAPGLLGAC